MKITNGDYLSIEGTITRKMNEEVYYGKNVPFFEWFTFFSFEKYVKIK